MGPICVVKGVEEGSLASHHFSRGKEYAEADLDVSVTLHWVYEALKVGASVEVCCL